MADLNSVITTGGVLESGSIFGFIILSIIGIENLHPYHGVVLRL
jgi:hypothetical protein